MESSLFTTTPTTLSGNHIGIFRIPVSAMLAAIVTALVPLVNKGGRVLFSYKYYGSTFCFLLCLTSLMVGRPNFSFFSVIPSKGVKVNSLLEG